MRIFVAASYSSKINYETGEVFPEYQAWLEDNLTKLEGYGHTVFCALRSDQYRINDADPAAAFSLDKDQIKLADALLAFVADNPSEGVQTEVGMAIGQGMPVAIAHLPEHQLGYFNQAIIRAGDAMEVAMPLVSDPFAAP